MFFSQLTEARVLKFCPQLETLVVTVVSRRISSLLFADDFVQLASFEQSVQHKLDRFSDACIQAVLTISAKTTKELRLSRNPSQCALQKNGEALPQFMQLKYLAVIFKNNKRQNKKVDTRIGKANGCLREIRRSVITKRELSKTAKLSVFESVFAPTTKVMNL